MAFFSFLLKRKFYLHLLYAVLLTIILLFVVLQLLKVFTHHNEAYIVPDFTGYTEEDLDEQNFTEIFDFIFTDSIYNNELVPGSVVMQNPAPGSKVKKGRNVYITTVAITPEMTTMPELKDLTLRQAMALMKLHGLKVNRLVFEPHIAENAVIGQYIGEDTISADSVILKGSTINLVLGQGRNRPVPIPFLAGLTPKQARELINLSSFNIGKEYFLEEPDPERSKVYRQEPSWNNNNSLYRGDYINVWYRSDLYFNFDSLIDVLKPDTLFIDTKDIRGLEEYESEEF